MTSLRTPIAGCRALALALTLAALAIAGLAPTTARASGERALVLASRPSADEAIGVAGLYTWLEGLRVVRARNGAYAVVAGPLASGEADALRARLVAEGSIPPDAFLGDPGRLADAVWTPSDPGETVAFVGEPLVWEVDGVELRVAYADADDEFAPPLVEGFANGTRVFSALLEEAAFSRLVPVRLRALALDPQRPRERQIVVTTFSGGAHCCAQVRIFARIGPGAFAEIDGGMLDGDEGFLFEDLDGGGTAELTSGDQSFLYAFGPYVTSFMPLRVERLVGTRLVDLRGDASVRHAFVRDRARLEHVADLHPELWNENGFLAAWVATMANLGAFDEAWERMLRSYDRTSDWPFAICEGERVDGLCPEALERPARFPDALEEHLRETGYLPAGR